MAGSQLKRLKSSLRDQGIIGPQKSKKQKKKAAEEARARGGEDKRLRKSVALESIREQFNPFQFKMNARGPKFPVTSLRSQKEGLRGGIQGRPAAALSRSEEKRRDTLLVDMQRRNKVGGILDRRLGEGDPNMTPEERALERFAFEKQRTHSKKGASMFDLEDDADGFVGLTHMGKSLAVDEDEDVGGKGAGVGEDDFDDSDLSNGDDDDDDDDDDGGHPSLKKLKRMRSEMLQNEAAAAADGADGEPERKKTKKEIMQEVITKSKLHKYERQAVKEADDDERMALDKMLPELQQLLFSQKKKADAVEKVETVGTAGKGTGSRLADKVDKEALEKAYDLRLRQLMQDKKAEPTARTKTEEEVAAEQSAHLKKLEESRLKRMRGEIEPEEGGADGSDDDGQEAGGDGAVSSADHEGDDDFQLGQGIRVRHTAAELGFDDEDDFLIDDDLVASGSEVEEDDDDDGDDDGDDNEEEEASGSDVGEENHDEEDEFTRGLLTEEEKNNPAFASGNDDDGIPYTFPCPQTHAELLAVVRGLPTAKLPTVVQRIRALHHPKLEQGNKERLGRFAAALVDHVAYLGDEAAAGRGGANTDTNTDTEADNADSTVTYATIESLVRHIHSLAKSTPIDVAVAFRIRLAGMAAGENGVGAGGVRRLGGGDLVVLTAVATLFPTSDHFHQVVTPAMLVMARFLEQRIPRTLADHATTLYVCTLFLQYQQLSQRFVPELVQALVNSSLALAPARLPAAQHAHLARLLPVHDRVHDAHASTTRLSDRAAAVRPLRPSDCFAMPDSQSPDQSQSLRASLLATAVALLAAAATLWQGHVSLEETLEPMAVVLRHLLQSREQESKKGKEQKEQKQKNSLPKALKKRTTEALATVQAAMEAARKARRPLELHHHRPQAIRTLVPRFEDDYDPDKHYDPNQERSEAKKLQAEYKRERKGALRELRKDAAFMAREKLKIKKAKDAAYEKKYRRIVAEIQGEEGRAANEYERERQGRKNKR